MTITKEQEKRIEQFRNIMLNLVGYPETKEIKREQIHDIGYGTISVVITVGSIGDEGTMAEVVCRDTAQVFIGPKGGCFTMSTARSGKNKGKTVRYDDNLQGVVWRSVFDYN